MNDICGEQHVVAVRQRVFQQIPFHHCNPRPLRFARETLARNCANARQFEQCAGQGNAAHTHEVEEVFFVLQGELTVFLEDENGRRIDRTLMPWE